MIKRAISQITGLEELVNTSMSRIETYDQSLRDTQASLKKEQLKTAHLEKVCVEMDKLAQEKDLKVQQLEKQTFELAPLQSDKVESLRQQVIKGFWKTGSESHDILVKCDRVELTGLLARKDYEQLLCTFLAALECSVDQPFTDVAKTECNESHQQETSDLRENDPM